MTMYCKCISKIGQLLTEQAEDKGDLNPRVFASFVGTDFETGLTTIHMPFILHADNRPHNTLKGTVLGVPASFCPFCGTPAVRRASEAAC